MTPSRRDVLAAAMALPLVPRVTAANPAMVDPEALMAQVRAYAATGIHRTGTPGDAAATDHFAGVLSEAGYAVETPSFPVRVWSPERFDLRLPGLAPLPVFPLWYPCATPPDGVTAPLAAWDPARPEAVKGRIAVTEWPLSYVLDGSETVATLQRIAAAGAVAALGRLQAPQIPLAATPNVAPPWCQTPWTLPVASVRPGDVAALTASLEAGAAARLVLTGTERPDGSARNVVARRPGTGPALIVTTPLSAWFESTGERGGGVALFAWLAQRLRAEPLPGDPALLFAATSGHELGHLGQDVLLPMLPGPNETRAWLHLGASIAARPPVDLPDYAGVPALVAAPGLLPPVASAFAPLNVTPRTDRPDGELKAALAGGWPAFGMFGANRLFHAPEDSAAEIRVDWLAGVAAAAETALRQIFTV